MMEWRLCCLLLAALAVRTTYAKPLIEDATFSDIDLVAEDSEQSAVYVEAPIRPKRSPQFFGNNCVHSSSSASSSSVSGNAISSASSSSVVGCGGGDTGDTGVVYNSYAQQKQQTPVEAAVNHEHNHHMPLPPFQESQQYSHPPSVLGSHRHRHSPHEAHPSPPPLPYHDNSLGFHNYPPPPPPPGFHGYRPFGYHPGPPFGGPPGFGPPPFGGHPGFHRGPPRHHPRPHPPKVPSSPPQTTTPAIPVTTIRPEANAPASAQPNKSSAAEIPIVTSTPLAPSTTTEPVFDIDIRIAN